jgi:membrane-bound lytic murein transglycosylase MltF
MTKKTLTILLTFLLACIGSRAVAARAGEPPEDELARALLMRVDQPYKGDLPRLMQRGTIRVLTSYSKTNFFFVMQQPAGFEYELLTGYEKYLNKSRRKGARRVHLIFIPTPFSRLLSDLAAGRGDIAAAGLTITAERRRKVNFSDPYLSDVSEVVVLNARVKGIKRLEDLAGRMFYVRKSSSYVQHLRDLNRKFKRRRLKAIRIKEADSHLATEDILEMVNAGVVKISVADHHIAAAWAEVLPNIVVRKDLAINTGGKIAWAVRKNNPKLRKSLNAYIRKNKSGTMVGNMLFKRYYRNSKWIKNPLTKSERRKLAHFLALFKKYGDKYGFDYLALAAQAYQESGLDQKKKSPAGAVGIMQIRPQTAADKAVGIRNIQRLENNIHAGVKYLAYLREAYFNDPKMSPVDRVYFSWAAYNAGPSRIAKLRGKAARMGVDPNKWFYNVENVAARFIGREPVDYVASINKYYVAYRLAEDLRLKKDTGSRSEVPKTETVSESPSAAGGGGQKGTDKSALKASTKKASAKAPARKPATRYHTVRKGETLYGISRRYGLSVNELKRLNKIPAGAALKPGERLRLSR